MKPNAVEAEIKTALEQTIEGLQIINRDWRYIYLNTAAAAQGKSDVKSLVGKTMMEAYPGIETTIFFKELKHVMDNRDVRIFENEFEYPDKSKCWFELFIEPYTNGVLIRSVDITARKNLESQLRQSQKMEAIGRLAGGVAHDFNNKLAIMMAYCEMAKMRLDDKESVETYLDKILSAVTMSATLTRQLLAFSRRQVLDLKVTDLNRLLRDSADGLSQIMGERIKLNYELAPDLYNVQVDPSQLDQVILNLAVNARDSMPGGGVIIFETANVDLDEQYARMHPEVLPGSYVMLSVSDTGTGMDRDTLEHIFEPFFTTKPMDKGTGLGLSSVHGIIKQSRGHVWAYSELQKGSVFKIYLPAANKKSLVLNEPEQGASLYPAGGTETILLVEDDSLLREAYRLALKSSGYTVMVADSPTAAIQIFEANIEHIDLLLTDLVMPEMGGKELSQKLKARKANLKVIFMSGYTENSIARQGILDTESVLLQKPISIRNLRSTLREVLEGHLKKGII